MTNAMWKKFFNFIKNAMKKGGDMALANRPLRAILLTSLFAVLGVLDAYNAKYLVGSEELISLEAWLGGLLAFWGVLLLARRTANQDKQLTIQINKEIDDRFIAAVTLLGSRESSARTGAVYSLYHLAIEGEKYRKQIAQILCSHIRSKTQEKGYQAQHKDRPSNEIQTAIDILFRNLNGVNGLYCQNFSQEREFPKANLSHAYLCGADFKGAECYGADFSFAKCQSAKFDDAQCQNSVFRAAECQGADFTDAKFDDANFNLAECYGANFFQSSCEGVSFILAKCQGAYFSCAYLPYANFRRAKCEGAYFDGAYIPGVDFSFSNCQGARFMVDDIKEVVFRNADFRGAYSNDEHKLEDRIGRKTEVNLLSGKEFPLEGAIVGILEDSEEIRKIIEIIKKWEAL